MAARLACEVCGTEFDARRTNARFCSAACRQRSSRANRGESTAAVFHLPTPATSVAVSGVADAVRVELGDKVNTTLGRSALVLAEQLDSGRVLGSQAAAVSKQLTAQMAILLASGAAKDNPLAELAAEMKAARLAR